MVAHDALQNGIKVSAQINPEWVVNTVNAHQTLHAAKSSSRCISVEFQASVHIRFAIHYAMSSLQLMQMPLQPKACGGLPALGLLQWL